MTYTIENNISGFVLGTFEANSEQQALQLFAEEAGYNSVNDIPNFNKDELDIYKK